MGKEFFQFYPKTDSMDSEDVDELIMDVVREHKHELKMVESDIDDAMRQKYVDISQEKMFEAISYGEDWYVHHVMRAFVEYVNGGR